MSNLSDLRKEVFDKLLSHNLEREKALKKLDIIFGFSNDEEVTISFDELKLFNRREVIEVSKEVSFEKIYQSDSKITFLTYMKEGGSFGVHNHDCFEIVRIIKGNLFEKTRGLKTYGEGDIIAYSPKETHKPYATKNSIYEVTFYKDLI